jgi:hypothetical protein
MKLPPENLPRYLPTLTEVVSPGKCMTPMLDTEALIDRVMQRLTPLIQTQLSAVMNSLVQQEIRQMEPRLLREVEQMARETVAQSLAEELALSIGR